MVKEFEINVRKIIDTIANIANIESVDLIDKITLIDAITDVGTVNLLNTVNLIKTISSITNIANIASVDLIDNISFISLIERLNHILLIDEITKIGEISKIRDITHRPAEFIANPGFEEGWTGWRLFSGSAVIDAGGRISENCLRFFDYKDAEVYQYFFIPLGVDWMESMYFYLRSSYNLVDLVTITFGYTDGTTSSQTFKVTNVNTWEKMMLSPTAGKKIEFIYIYHAPTHRECILDSFTTVF